MDVTQAIAKIRSSKKYKHISEEIIKQKTQEYINKNNLLNLSKNDLKDIKAKLHRIHGSFRGNEKKAFDNIQAKNYKKVLKSNRSTLERLNDYSEIYEKIFSITGKPKKIVDLGCGLNPVSIPMMGIDLYDLKYNAYDINESEIIALNEFFKLEGIDGKADVLDLTEIENIKKLPDCDLVLMFKLVDILEDKGHKYSEEIIKILSKKCKFMVVSFATRTIGGKRMRFANRGWIERMLSRIRLKFEKVVFNEAGEVFYIVKS